MTNKSTVLSREDAFKLLSEIGLPDADLPNKKTFTGKEIFSYILPKGLNIEFKAKVYACDKCIAGTCEHEGYVVIHNGELKRGVIDMKAIGREAGKLTSIIEKEYGEDVAHKFIDRVSQLGIKYLDKVGFTIGLDDIHLSEAAYAKIKETIDKANKDVEALVKEYEAGKLELLPGKDAKTTLEERVFAVLQKVSEECGRIVNETLGETNATVMTRTGARGSMTNILQLVALVGQTQTLGEKARERISRGYRGRVLSHFVVGDMSPMAHGFIANSFESGMTPYEFFFDAMSGRGSLMDKSLRTRHSGYLERRLMNALQDLKVEYDYTIRDNRKVIIQFFPGEDGINPAKSDWGKLDVRAIVQAVLR